MKLNYKEYGSGPRHILILHGLLGSAQNWHSVARELSSSFHLIVPDQRNHGDSPHGEHRLDLLRDDALELIQFLKLDTVILMGHSMGGVVAMSFAFAYPQLLNGLIVVDVAPEISARGMAWIFEALQGVDLSQVRSRTDADEQLALKIKSPAVRQFLLQNLKRQDDGSFTWRCNLNELHRYVRERTSLRFPPGASYSGPTLFIGGARSDYQIDRKQELIRMHFPNYRLVMISGAGHWVHFESRQAFMAAVRAFLETIP